jgi:hypothetical protein
MEKIRKLSMAVVLALTLAPSAFAGITDTPPAPAPPPPSVMATGITDTQPVASANDSAVSIALNLLQTVLSVF